MSGFDEHLIMSVIWISRISSTRMVLTLNWSINGHS